MLAGQKQLKDLVDLVSGIGYSMAVVYNYTIIVELGIAVSL